MARINPLQVGIVANTKTFAQAAASVVGGIGSAVISTAGSVVRCGLGGGAVAAGNMAPAGVLGMVGGFAVGSVVGAATGLLTNVPSAYRSVRGGFGSAASAYAEHEAECVPRALLFISRLIFTADTSRNARTSMLWLLMSLACSSSLDLVPSLLPSHDLIQMMIWLLQGQPRARDHWIS